MPVQDVAEVREDPGLSPATRQKLAETGGATALGAALAGSSGLPLSCLPAIAALAQEHPPEQVTHVLYHMGCKDGFGAALAAWKALGDKAEYIPVSYDAPPPDLPPDARVALVDFSYKRPQLQELRNRVQDVVILDHHETAQQDLQGIDYAVFDMHRAGSGLSWHYFHPGEALPDFIGHLEDYDLWRKAMPGTDQINMALDSYPMEFPKWDELMGKIDQLKAEGETIQRFIDRQVDRISNSATRYGVIAGHRVPVSNSPVDGNELAHRLLHEYPDAPFVGVYYDKTNGQRKWSLRSRGEFNVSALAKQFPGGGGHATAAGFTEKAPKPIEVVPPPPPPAS